MMNETVGQVGDVFSLYVLFAYFLSALPTVALVLTVVWTAIRIYETETVQRLLGKCK